ncbi:MAG: tetratricopeptide repeat protein [Nitrospirales bacterium]|nr:tetratricopeptide repeat protein [Nitrospira sp.]MDR4501197.1 tetratricopeptide repeat protein [Nitrospirales bacterium]
MSYKIKTPAPTSSRGIDETELLSRKDHFLFFVEQNRTAVLGGLFLAILVGVVGGLVMWFEHRQTEEAWVLEGQAQAHYLDRSLDDAEQSKANVGKAAGLFREILADYPRTTPAQSALYLLGNSLAEQEDYKGAIEAYQRFIDQYGRNSMLQGLVRQRLAYAYLFDGDKEKAFQEFSDILSLPHVLNKDQVLFELAKLEEADGTLEKALVRYKDLVDQFPTSPYTTEASLRIQVLSPEESQSEATEPEKEESEDQESIQKKEEKGEQSNEK